MSNCSFCLSMRAFSSSVFVCDIDLVESDGRPQHRTQTWWVPALTARTRQAHLPNSSEIIAQSVISVGLCPLLSDERKVSWLSTSTICSSKRESLIISLLYHQLTCWTLVMSTMQMMTLTFYLLETPCRLCDTHDKSCVRLSAPSSHTGRSKRMFENPSNLPQSSARHSSFGSLPAACTAQHHQPLLVERCDVQKPPSLEKKNMCW